MKFLLHALSVVLYMPSGLFFVVVIKCTCCFKPKWLNTFLVDSDEKIFCLSTRISGRANEFNWHRLEVAANERFPGHFRDIRGAVYNKATEPDLLC